MASVPSLDKDLRKLRLDKYTPQATKEIRDWIEEMLGIKLQSGDLLEALKDGLALCSLINKAISPGVKAKPSKMPFVQRENISHFVRACQMPPLSLLDHDVFLTDDLYEAKDPAQVLQCINAFSRRANAVNPSAFPKAIDGKSRTALISPQLSGISQGNYSRPPVGLPNIERSGSNASDKHPTTWNPLAKGSYSRQISPNKGAGSTSPPGNVSSWSNRNDEGKTAPAWNIHQYGYMGGASQGNQGIAFGARRQITSAAPSIPNMAEKEQRRKADAEEAERQRAQAQEAEEKRELELEEQARLQEEHDWREETRKQQESARAEAEEEERKGLDELRRQKEKAEQTTSGQEIVEKESERASRHNEQNGDSNNRLRGQFLSQYRTEQSDPSSRHPARISHSTSEGERIKDLERQLRLARERELLLQMEAEKGLKQERYPEPSKAWKEHDWQDTERDLLRDEWQKTHDSAFQKQPPPSNTPAAIHAELNPLTKLETEHSNSGPKPPPRPLPDPSKHVPNIARMERHAVDNPQSTSNKLLSRQPSDRATTSEIDLQSQYRQDSRAKNQAGGWASKSLLEREMERERERQREWEEAQKRTADAPRDQREGAAPGQSWDIHQYGYTGGDSQNRGGPGLGVGGARRQIIGPRPPP